MLQPPQWLLQSPPQKNQKTPCSIISAANAAANSQLREIPVEIILAEILPRLPAKSLLRFKCVCKEWYSLISSTQFAKTHALHPSSLSSRFILSIDVECLFEVVDYGDSSNLELTKFRFHFSMDTDNYLIGSCHGLALLISSDEECDYSLVHDFNFEVLNPVFAAVVEIDCPDQFLVRSFKNRAKDFSFGFGYSSIHDDYYIVAVSFPECSSYPMIVVYVYSLKTRKWRGNGRPRNDKQHRPSFVFEDAWHDRCAILVKETLHWGITAGNTIKCILAFDLGSQERFKTMQLPYANFGEAGKDHSAFSLCCMDDCLCAWAYYEGGHVVEMWMMKEYGVQKSWTKLFGIKLRHACKYFFGFTKSKEVMLFHSDWLMILNFRSVPPKWVIKDLEDYSEAVNYVPSLLSPLAITSSEEGG